MEKRSMPLIARGSKTGLSSRLACRLVLLAAILALTAVMAVLRQQGGSLATAAGPIALALVPLCYMFIRLEAPAPTRGRGLPTTV